jgi:uncharacterized protein YjbI with pentapeptide repeats
MANADHFAKLMEGVEKWNLWRTEHPRITPNLSGVELIRAKLSSADFEGVNLRGANLTQAYLRGADLRNADLTEADLEKTDLGSADLSCASLGDVFLGEATLTTATLSKAFLTGSDLTNANCCGAILNNANLSATDLTDANLSDVNLSNASLENATLVRTKLTASKLTGCRVYGISAWDVNLEGAVQSNLIITPEDQPVIQVDNLEVAQFIYLLLNNERIRHVIDTITSKIVLILGRFTDDRKAVLEGIRGELRKRDYLPVLFDFEKPSSRNLTETVRTLAHLACFVIADITDATSIPQELMAIVPNLPSLPVQPLLLASQHKYGMFEDFRDYPWVLKEFVYRDQATLLAGLETNVIRPAERRALSLRTHK